MNRIRLFASLAGTGPRGSLPSSERVLRWTKGGLSRRAVAGCQSGGLMTDRILSAMVSNARSSAAAVIAAALLAGLMLASARAQLPLPPPAAPLPAAPKPPAASAPNSGAPGATAAQKPATIPAPAAPPAAPPIPPAQAGALPLPDLSKLIYSSWTKLCNKDSEANSKQVCFTGSSLDFEDGNSFIAAVLVEPDGDPKKMFRITLPLAVQLPYGARIAIDQQQPLTGSFFTCVPGGCLAEFEGTADLIGKLKKGQMLNLQAVDLAGNVFNLPLPLVNNAGNAFAKANQGPPADPKTIMDQRQQLQKPAEEARKKLENQPGSGAAR
jgi:invasion protein IalB